MPNCYLKTLKWSYNRIRNRDIFRQSVSLTYRGKDNFSNFLGGLATLIMFVILLGYTVVLLRNMFKRTDVSWNQNSIQTDLRYDDSGLLWDEEDPEFKIYWSAYNNINLYGELDNPEKAIKASYYYERNVRNDTTVKDPNINPGDNIRTLITDLDCSNSFSTSDDSMGFVGDAAPHCPTFSGYKLQGNEGGDYTHANIFMEFRTCYESRVKFNGTYTCAQDGIPEAIAKDSIIRIHLNNRYIDLNDIENPIKKYYDRPFQIQYKENKRIIVKFKLRKHEVILEDSFFPLPWDTEPKYFNSIEDFEIFEENIGIESSGLVYVQISRDPQVDQHQRRILNFLEVTGVLGGIFEIFELGFGVLLGLYSSLMFKRKIYKDLLKYEDKFKLMQKCIKNLEFQLKQTVNLNDIRAQSDHQINNEEVKEEMHSIKEKSSENWNEESKHNLVRGLEEEIKAHQSDFKPLEEGGSFQNEEEHNQLRDPVEDVEQNNLNSNPERQGVQNPQNTSHKKELNDSKFKRDKSKFFSILNKYKTMEEEMEKFSNSLDCLNIAYMVKTLWIQTKYILLKDPDYVEAISQDPSLNFDYQKIYEDESQSKVTADPGQSRLQKYHPSPSSIPHLDQHQKPEFLTANQNEPIPYLWRQFNMDPRRGD
ncbi:unnamed protein product [Moneuplotes crassus]|uniref:Uncharacterized protein n=1 Tax=Euplotes crassus TaxID=5936 RepID=A0AAD1Y806_EUPCR|nr:unnamed protein product [Moneuplotes crassus]